ncbi:unnamed protein product, partial [Vitis vinifera]
MRLRNGDLGIGSRQDVVDWIAKVHAHFGFGPLCTYLAINYLDWFLSVYEFLKVKLGWHNCWLWLAYLLQPKWKEIAAPRICYLVAEGSFESYSNSARLCLKIFERYP